MSKSSKAWSRRPAQLLWSGAAKRTSVSSAVKKSINGRSCRLFGMASTCWIRTPLSGDSSAEYRKQNEWRRDADCGYEHLLHESSPSV